MVIQDRFALCWVEATLKAQATLAATRAGLADCAPELDAAYESQVQAALASLEAALATENPQTKIGDATRLQTASAALDEATRPLAELLMDRAMEAMLRKRGLLK